MYKADRCHAHYPYAECVDKILHGRMAGHGGVHPGANLQKARGTCGYGYGYSYGYGYEYGYGYGHGHGYGYDYGYGLYIYMYMYTYIYICMRV